MFNFTTKIGIDLLIFLSMKILFWVFDSVKVHLFVYCKFYMWPAPQKTGNGECTNVAVNVVVELLKKGMWGNTIFEVSIESMSAHCLHHLHTIVHIQVPQLVLVVD